MNIFPVFLSFRHTYRRAAFRRVAGGALIKRGRCVAEMNHGRTRTTLTRPLAAPSGLGLWPRAARRLRRGRINVSPDLEWRERKRGVSVLVCGSSQRFEGAGIEEKVNKTDVGNAAVVVGSGLERVVGYHHLCDSLVKTNMKMSIAGAAPIHYHGWQHSKQIGVCPGIGKRENEFAGGCVEVEQYPVVFDVAVAKSFKVAGKRMV